MSLDVLLAIDVCRFVKGYLTKTNLTAKGEFVATDPTLIPGRDGIRVGDGFHNCESCFACSWLTPLSLH